MILFCWCYGTESDTCGCNFFLLLFSLLLFSILPAPTQRLFDRDDEDKAYRAQMQVGDKDQTGCLKYWLCCMAVMMWLPLFYITLYNEKILMGCFCCLINIVHYTVLSKLDMHGCCSTSVWYHYQLIVFWLGGHDAFLSILHQWHEKCIQYNQELTHITKPKWWSNLIVVHGL